MKAWYPNGYTRTQFNYCGTPNVINPARLDQNMVKFLKTYDTGTPLTGNPNLNAYAANPHIDDSDHYMARIDEQLGGKDTLFFRYDQLNVTDVSPNSLTQSISNSVAAKDLGAGWNHLFTIEHSLRLSLRHRDNAIPSRYSRYQWN